jgi:hypothetical protein
MHIVGGEGIPALAVTFTGTSCWASLTVTWMVVTPKADHVSEHGESLYVAVTVRLTFQYPTSGK